MKLDMQHKHIMLLIERDRDPNGWATISEQLYRPLSENIPSELVMFEKLMNGGRARLTAEGQKVLDALVWLE